MTMTAVECLQILLLNIAIAMTNGEQLVSAHARVFAEVPDTKAITAIATMMTTNPLIHHSHVLAKIWATTLQDG